MLLSLARFDLNILELQKQTYEGPYKLNCAKDDGENYTVVMPLLNRHL